METHSLFSLEIVVEKLYLPNVSCRFPTIACKLLDFPVITIDLVEKSTAESIRNKVKSQPDWTLPDQFENLKDFEDTFCFKHGKSCLFKICPQTLKSLLLNVPMYVMVLDTLPNTPKLTGNASVPLDAAIKKICGDLDKNGADIPVIYKDTGLLRIYNLMGKEIGYMTFGYRLLYLGSTLLPHITVDESKMESGVASQQVLMPDLSKDIQENPIIDLHTETVKNISKEEETLPQTVDYGKNAKSWNSSIKYTENVQTAPRLELKSDPSKYINKYPGINLNTEKLARTISQAETLAENIDPDKYANFVISEAVLKTRVDHQPKDLKVPVHDNQIPIQNLNDPEIQPGEKDPYHLYCPPPIFYRKSNSKILSSEPEILNNHECNAEDEKVQQPDEHLPFEDFIEEPKNSLAIEVKREKSEKISKTLQNNPETKTVDTLLATDLNKYPYLSGILKELSLIDIPGVIQQIIDNVKERHSEKSSGPDRDQQRGKSKKKSVREPTRRTPMSDGGAERQLPKNKSWIRRTQQLSGRKSSLEFGLTKTHILRLNKIKSLDDEVNESGKIRKMENKIKMDTIGLKSSKNNRTMLPREVPQEKPSKTVRNELHAIKERNEKQRNEVNALTRRMEVVRNEVNVLTKGKEEVRNKVNVTMERNEDVNKERDVTTERNKEVKNRVNATKEERNDVGNEINVTMKRKEEVGNEVEITMEERHDFGNEVNVERGRNEADELQERLSEDRPTKYGVETEEISTSGKQKETDPWETTVITKKEESDLEKHWKKSSILSDISINDEHLEDRKQPNRSVKVRVYSKEESVEGFQSETGDENDKFVSSDDNKSNEQIQENKNKSFVDLLERQGKESESLRKQDSLTETGSITEDDHQPQPHQGDGDNKKVLSFEKPSRPNISPLVPMSATTPQPFFSRGPSLQESNASSSSMLSETPLPTPRTRRLPLLIQKESVHTDSVSSYRPSEDNDEMVSCSSSKRSKSPEDYSEDFLPSDSDSDDDDKASLEDRRRPKILSENKLGYTIW